MLYGIYTIYFTYLLWLKNFFDLQMTHGSWVYILAHYRDQ